MTQKRSDSADSNLCQFSFSDGRLCRMLRHPKHPNLCPFHAYAELQLLESQRLGAEMATTLTGDYHTATDINHVLGKVFTALAQGRIPQRNAATLAYLGQIMHQAIPTIQAETKFYYTFEVWQDMIRKGVRLSPCWPLPDSEARTQHVSTKPETSPAEPSSEAEPEHETVPKLEPSGTS